MRFLRNLSALLVAAFILATPVVAFAATSTTSDEINKACETAKANGGEQPSYCKTVDTVTADTDPVTGANGIFVRVTNVIGFISGVVAIVIIIIAGGRLVLSRGDSAKIVTARQTIIYALVGLVVIVTARQIIVFILTRI